MSTRPLSRKQIAVAAYMAEHPLAKKKEVAAHFGVSASTISNWCQLPAFIEYLDASARELAQLAEIMPALMEMAIEERDATAARLVLELNGMISNQTEVTLYVN